MKTSFMKRALVLIFTVVLIALSANIQVVATVYVERVSDIPSDFVFYDNKIIVVLDHEHSMRLNEYSPSDFANISCKNITDLTEPLYQELKSYRDNVIARNIKETDAGKELGHYLKNYNQILCLELTSSDTDTMRSAISKLKKTDGVIAVCPNYRTQLYAYTNDPYCLIRQETMWNQIDLYDAWDIEYDASAVKVGVVDTGIDSTHPDLVDNLMVDHFKDFTTGSIMVSGAHADDDSHGTHVAGIIGAKGNNGIGVSGVCWDVNMVSYKVFALNEDENTTTGELIWLIRAINYATLDNVDILNMSVGVITEDDNGQIYDDPEVAQVFTSAINAFPGLVVCAAGNDGEDLDDYPAYPAILNLPNLITVGACQSDNNRVYFSNYGQNEVDIFAPGVDIYSTIPVAKAQNGIYYDYMSGTSMATPMVSGVAALMLSVNPSLSPEEIKHIIVNKGVDVDINKNTYNHCVSGGRLNAYKALWHLSDTNTNDRHQRNINSYSSSGHTVVCGNCNFFKQVEHQLYFDSEGSTNVIGCLDCAYTFTNDESPEYSYIDDMRHAVDVPSGAYKFFEFHTFIVVSDLLTCIDCGYIRE